MISLVTKESPLKGTHDEWNGFINKRDNNVINNGEVFYDGGRFSYHEPSFGEGSFIGGSLRYKVEFPYYPKYKNRYVINLPYDYMTDDEIYAYVKEHANDNDDMKDISDHLIQIMSKEENN